MKPAKLPEQNLNFVIALLTEINEGDEPDFGKVHSFCEELHEGISARGGKFCVFSLKGFSEEGIDGYFYDQEKWKKAQMPLPNVIYNRISSRRSELNKRFDAFLNKLDSLGISIFNQRFLSKWTIHQFLVQEDHLHPFLPETYLFSEEKLSSMLERHKELYLKPVHGSQGRQIIRLIQEHKQIRAVFSTLPANEYSSYKNTQDLAKALSNAFKAQLFLIQQGLPLYELNGRRMDYRVLCHKNPQNIWKVTSIVSRVSAQDFFVSNIARGGEIMPPLHTLSLIFGKDQARQQLLLMKELALETAETIARHADGDTAELGIDIGIDLNGKLWLIEVNSKPSKNFEERGSKIRPSAKAIIDYCYRFLKI